MFEHGNCERRQLSLWRIRISHKCRKRLDDKGQFRSLLLEEDNLEKNPWIWDLVSRLSLENKRSPVSDSELVEFLYLHVFLCFVYTTYSSSVSLDWSFFTCCAHVSSRQDVVTLVTVPSYSTFHRTKDPVTYIFTRLRLGKVVPLNRHTHALSDVSHSSNKLAVVITASFI